MAHINARRDGIFYMVKLKVLSAKEQIVAGTNTVIEILAQESTCETNVIYQLFSLFLISKMLG